MNVFNFLLNSDIIIYVNNMIDKEIKRYALSSIIITVLMIVVTIVIASDVIKSNFHSIFINKNVVINIEPKINKKLTKLSDIDGIKDTANKIILTNNGTNKRYQILLKPYIVNKNIKVSINGRIMRLSDFVSNTYGYILYEDSLLSGYSAIFEIKMWLDQYGELDEYYTNFKLNVKILDE